ncbi:MAG TPA: TetR/AcrR family transcriptional regulator [Streptosporangiaceae bacterium]|nr:TetR/AcrR family transcriptional regulator [Streptosporangiaceae bacterium]
MATRDQWIDEGLAALSAEGIAGVRIDRLATRLGVTQGSFHHHFSGKADYQHALLQRYEADEHRTIATAVAAVSDLPASEALTALPRHARIDLRLDAAIRGWAVESDQARDVLCRVDKARLDTLITLWRRVLRDPHRARIAALIPHLIIVGASLALPSPSPSELQEIFELLAAIAPAVSTTGDE